MTDNSAALRKLFEPETIALIGMSRDPEKIGSRVLENLVARGFAGEVTGINPQATELGGVRCVPSVSSLEEPPDLAFITLPAARAAAAAEECIEAGVPAVVVAANGFAESGTADGVELERRLRDLARASGTRLLGPNTNGFYNAALSLALGYNGAHALDLRPGPLHLISHSGALFSILASRAHDQDVGIGLFVAVGNEADIDVLDVVEWSLADEQCRVIGLVLEGLRDGDRFRALAEQAAATGRRLIALKLGQSDVGKQAILAHSSRLAGSARTYRALLEQSGVVCVETPEGLVNAAALLALYPSPRVGGIAGVTTTGAGAALVADAAARHEVDLATLGTDTVERLHGIQRYATAINPIDLGAVGLDRSTDVVSTLMDDPAVSCLVVYAHQLLRESSRRGLFEAVALSTRGGVPAVVLAPGGLSPDELRWYADAGIPVSRDTDSCFQGLRALTGAQGSEAAGSLRPPPRLDPELPAEAGPIPSAAAERLLRACGIPVVRTLDVRSPSAAGAAMAGHVGSLVVKGVAPSLAHKSDLGLVELEVAADAVEAACEEIASRGSEAGIEVESFQIQPFARGFEALAGVHREPGLGPILVAGLGGVFTEDLDDVAAWVIPTDRHTINARLRGSRLGRVLLSPRQARSDAFETFVDALMGLQDLTQVVGPRLGAVDLNPVIVGAEGIQVVDWYLELGP